jgi:3-deoxy-D-manno-octulosonate 8-phosphate phosphatase (KDO 8-P phosphatase)
MTLQDRLRRIRFIACDVDGVLTDGRMWYDGDGKPFRCLHARDGAALTLWHLMDGKTALVSGLGSKAIEAIVAQWKCAELHAFVRDKARVCREMAERHGISLDEMAFIGDDLIDLPAMRTVGLAVSVADAADEAKALAHMITQVSGGQGAVREVVYAVLSAQGRLDEAIHRYCSRTDHGQ